ncbi:hypothetical protein GCM10010123_36960 [Pilimelia anulata]|uniref:Carrier domain-containing protein n=1 Tax=Pilimelia anulata TaxID=53371 RepID=A0A8J3BEV6_9ACTN|nr:non-ribosomal peptide synthetase [Pilimelia anulata]GGK03632.1 hypothetical protein GCM10010123_36960 [Pilimelia anulata]
MTGAPTAGPAGTPTPDPKRAGPPPVTARSTAEVTPPTPDRVAPPAPDGAAPRTPDATAPSPPDLLAAVARHAVRRPAAVAVRGRGGALDYRGLHAAALATAAALRSAGVDPGDRVGLCLPRGPELVAGLLGAVAAGLVAVPLDPATPALPRRLWAADVDPATILVTPGTAADCADLDVPLTHLPPPPGPPDGDPSGGSAPSDAEVPRGEPDPAPAGPPGVDAGGARRGQAAVIIRSAGVEEEPRAVVVTRADLAGPAAWLAAALPPGTLDRVPLDAPVDSYLALTQLAAALTAGGTLLADDPAPEPTVRIGPPGRHAAASADGAGLVLLGGPVTGPVRRGPALPGTPAPWLAWGATETAGPALAGPLRADDPQALGPPRPGTTAYALDAALRPVPAGAVGRLYLGGSAVTRGYLGQPALTATRYPADPYAADPGARMLATDDLVRRGADGVLRWVGRLDQCPGVPDRPRPPVVAEAALRRHGDVADAAVVAAPDGRLVAAAVARTGAAPTVAGLRVHLAATVPAPLVPDALALLPDLPRLPTGRPHPRAILGAVARAGSAAPGLTDAERRVAGAWVSVLGHPADPGCNFFDAGGTSMGLIRLSAVLAREFHRPVDVIDLFRLPTIRAMAAHLTGADR